VEGCAMLSQRQQIARMRYLGAQALRSYPLAEPELRFVAHGENTTFRVGARVLDVRDRFLLRVCHSGCPLGSYAGAAFCFGGLRPTLGTRPPTGSFPDDLVSNGASRYGR
jgi:hypothetical protein